MSSAGGKLKVLDLPQYLVPLARYSLLPFNFMRLDAGAVLLTNDLGEYSILSPEIFDKLVNKSLDTASPAYLDLRAKYFVSDERSSIHARVMASKYRTKKAFLEGFTKLHIFVVTLRCDHSCPYCQVSRQSQDRLKYDMTPETAKKAVALMLRSPAPVITCEFQGGEPLLNFGLVREVVQYAKECATPRSKAIDFVICTNLSTLTNEHLEFCKVHQVKISTSLDGPAFLHDRNRPSCKGSSHAIVERNIRRAQEALGRENVSALMTTTRDSLGHGKEIVDEYLRLDLGSIFLRSLSPFGFAAKTMNAIGYSSEEFVRFYKETLSYILSVNRAGRTFSEACATLILQKILTPYAIGYADLQSPAAAGFGVAVYNYDSGVYVSDESRMLAEMNDTTFRLGNVLEHTYEEIFFGERMRAIAAASCNEALAGCSECAFMPFCGADPIYHYATQGDIFGHRPTSGFCKKNMAIIRHLFDLLRPGNREVEEIFWSWINQAALHETSLSGPQWQLNSQRMERLEAWNRGSPSA